MTATQRPARSRHHDTLGPPRWRGQPGRLEVWYLTATDPATGTGLWLHHEVVAPTGGGPWRLKVQLLRWTGPSALARPSQSSRSSVGETTVPSKRNSPSADPPFRYFPSNVPWYSGWPSTTTRRRLPFWLIVTG